jgi:hypothetical protein
MTHETNNIVVYHTHQGFGDIISCSPIVNSLARNNPDKKYLFITKTMSHAKNLRRFCIPEVNVVYIDNYPVNGSETDFVDTWASSQGFTVIRSGFMNYHYSPSFPWDLSFYENVNVPYEDKTTHFWIDRNEEVEKDVARRVESTNFEKYAFVHDDLKRGLSLAPKTTLPIVRNLIDVDIADMIGILENATELHMMGSSLLCLADLMQLPRENQSLFYYTLRGDLNVRGCKRWTKV